MCDVYVWYQKTFLVQLYWHLAIQLYCIVYCIITIPFSSWKQAKILQYDLSDESIPEFINRTPKSPSPGNGGKQSWCTRYLGWKQHPRTEFLVLVLVLFAFCFFYKLRRGLVRKKQMNQFRRTLHLCKQAGYGFRHTFPFHFSHGEIHTPKEATCQKKLYAIPPHSV